MAEKSKSHSDLLPNLFRLEYSKMTAVLSRHFGLRHIEIAEDIASDTFLKASEVWAIDGVPGNPAGWLYSVAKNKAKDYLRHQAVIASKRDELEQSDTSSTIHDIEFTNQVIEDSQLAMIFAVCDPANSKEGQICLALQILCGFSIEEIANAFLAKPETVKKRLARARANLRNHDFRIESLGESTINSRLDVVLRALYLLFNEGYFSRTQNQLVRKELCREAIRLTLILRENQMTNTPEVSALLALMCFQSSRFDARTNELGEAILFEDQDPKLWNQELIERGNRFLVDACMGEEISKYHIEAGIAYWHTTSMDGDKWQHILQLYNQLIVMEYSPVTALNRAFAFARVYGNERAIEEVEKLRFDSNSYYHALLGYLYAPINKKTSIDCYKRAMLLTKSKVEKKTLSKEIERLTDLGNN